MDIQIPKETRKNPAEKPTNLDLGFETFETDGIKKNPSYKESLSSTAKDHRFHQVVHLMVDYWEMKPHLYEERLQSLAASGVKRVSAFVPWAHFETDIHHSFKKFLKAAVATKMKVRLLVLPSLGLNYPYSGIPKDILQNQGNIALSHDGRPILNLAVPHIFCLPTFFSPEVVKRFGNFLLKINTILQEVFHEAGDSDFCEIIISDGLFPYYQSKSAGVEFVGDFSAAQILAHREFLDREYTGSAGEAFKNQSYDLQNRHRFLTHMEKNLQEKSELIFSRKNSHCRISKIKLVNLECTPALMEQSLLCEMFDAKPSVERYFEALLACTETGKSVFLSSAGTLRRFSEKERAFLVMASLICGGDVMLNAHFSGSASVQADGKGAQASNIPSAQSLAGAGTAEVSGLSLGFISKLKSLSNMLLKGDFSLHKQVTFLASGPLALHPEILTSARALAPSLFEVSSLPLEQKVREDVSRKLFCVDPGVVLRLIDVVQLFGLAQAGKVVVMPTAFNASDENKLNHTNYFPEAQDQLDRFRKTQRPIRINMGVSYEVYEYHSGFIVFYDAAAFTKTKEVLPGSNANEKIMELNGFIKAMLNLSEVGPICFADDSRIKVGFFKRTAQGSAVTTPNGSPEPEYILFLMNPTPEHLTTKVQFNQSVALSAFPTIADAGAMEGDEFELQVPALGVLSLGCAVKSSEVLIQPKSSASGFDSIVDVIGQGSAHQWN